MKFKEWLKYNIKEVSTTTACVANYARPLAMKVVKRKEKKRD